MARVEELAAAVPHVLRALASLLTLGWGPRASPPAEVAHRRDFRRSEREWWVLLARARARLAKARRLLAEGVGDEAAEEAWRAAVDALNAVSSALWGVEAASHQALRLLVRLLRERGLDVSTEFGVAEALHAYYYNPGGYDDATIEAMMGNVERLVEKVEAWLGEVLGEPRPRLTLPNPSMVISSLLARSLRRLAPLRIRVA